MCPQNPCSSPNPGVPEPQNVIKFRNEVVAEVMNSDEIMLEQAGPPPRETGGLPKGGFGHRHKLGERHMKKKVDVGVKCPQAEEHWPAGGRLSLPAWGRGGGARGRDPPCWGRVLHKPSRLPGKRSLPTGVAGHPDLR